MELIPTNYEVIYGRSRERQFQYLLLLVMFVAAVAWLNWFNAMRGAELFDLGLLQGPSVDNNVYSIRLNTVPKDRSGARVVDSPNSLKSDLTISEKIKDASVSSQNKNDQSVNAEAVIENLALESTAPDRKQFDLGDSRNSSGILQLFLILGSNKN